MLSAIGLLLDIVGAILIFLFGIASPYSKGMGLAVNLSEKHPKYKENKTGFALHQALSRAGIMLILFGFTLQLFDNKWVSDLLWSL